MKGSVQKQGETWRYAIYLGVENGKRRYLRKGGFLTLKAAQRAMQEALQSMDDNTSFVHPKPLTLGEYLATWLEDKSTTVRLSTMRHYKWIILSRVVPTLGSIPLQSLTPQHVESFYNSLQTGDHPLSARSMLHVQRVLNEALNRATKLGLMARNVAETLNTTMARKTEITVWTREEATAFLNFARGNRYYVAFVLALETGIRSSEILGVKWSDVDFEGAKLQVKRANSYGHSFELISGRRTVRLTPALIEVLRLHKETQAQETQLMGCDYQDHDLVVAEQDGTPLHQTTLYNHFCKLLKESGLPKIRFHDLRHTYGRQLIEARATPSEQSILDMYAHVYRPSREDSAQRFKSFLHGDVDD